MTFEIPLPAIRERLSSRPAVRFAGEVQRKAAIAAVLRARAASPELLLIRRAERVGDPWSGHMALPGGHHEAHDSDLLATVLRETHEEVGLDLRAHDLLGPLDEVGAVPPGVAGGLLLAPFVFELRSDAELTPNHEVADVVWAPIGPMISGATEVIKEFERGGETLRFPGFQVGDQIVWGLTYRILQNFFALLRD